HLPGPGDPGPGGARAHGRGPAQAAGRSQRHGLRPAGRAEVARPASVGDRLAAAVLGDRRGRRRRRLDRGGRLGRDGLRLLVLCDRLTLLLGDRLWLGLRNGLRLLVRYDRLTLLLGDRLWLGLRNRLRLLEGLRFSLSGRLGLDDGLWLG